MKIKLFNGAASIVNLTPVTGGFDADSGMVTIIVKGEHEPQAGMIQLAVPEAHKLAAMLLAGSEVKKVEVK